jgi:probable F420-dependent oxidoreductase
VLVSAEGSRPRRWGITLPLAEAGWDLHRELVSGLDALGYTDAWTGETNGADAFTPLALASQWAPTLRLGPAIVPVYTRGPALLAMQAATLADLAPGRFVLGIGSSSPAIVTQWNGLPLDKPLERTRDTLRFLRRALAGEKVTERYETFEVSGFRLASPPAVPPPIAVAALRPSMLALAAAEADAAITNWLSAQDVGKVRGEVGDGIELLARIFVIPTEDPELARRAARRSIAAYLTVPAYAAFHRWLGRGGALAEMQSRWYAGDRRGALAAIPDEVVDDLIVHGTPAECRSKVEAYAAAGVTVPVMALLPTPELESGGPAALLDTLTALGR